MRPLIFNIDKPVGMTSYDIIRHFKKNYPLKSLTKIGHLGTLDPFASGVLLIAINGASRINDWVHLFLPKTYLAQGILGQKTATGDLTSNIIWEDQDHLLKEKISSYQPSFIQQLLREKFLGEYWQVPPHYSACKFQGRPLHEWARTGVNIEKEAKKRVIEQLDVVDFQYPLLTLRVRVSSGTYIRKLFEDVAETLGTIGVLESLRRESIGHLSCEHSLTEEKWPWRGKNEKGLEWNEDDFGLSLDQVIPLPQVPLNDLLCKDLLQGKKIPLNQEVESRYDNKFWMVSSSSGQTLGMAEKREDSWFPIINFYR